LGVSQGTGLEREKIDAEYNDLQALIAELTKLKPASSKGVYIRKVALSSTMGVGVRVDSTTIA